MDSGLGARIQKVSDVRRYFENRAIAAEHPNGDRIVIVPVGDVFAARQLTKKIAGSPGMTVNLTEDRKTVVLITPNAENATRDAAELCAPSADVTEVEGVTLELAPGEQVCRTYSELCGGTVVTARGGEWAAATVGGILDHPVYIGKVRAGDEVFDGQHEPVVDPTVWAKVRQLRDARVKRSRGRDPKGQHLFRKGMLRCGECGWALVPRTREGGHQVYVCRGRVEHGSDHCSIASILREPIDTAVYDYFERVGLDVEATRAQIAEARNRKLAEVRALRVEAERELQLSKERLARVEGDYLNGKLGADDWKRFASRLTEERAAAEAEAERLKVQEAEVEGWGELRDAEAEALRKLAAIRAAIAGEVRDAEGIEAVRAALARLFDGFTVHKLDADGKLKLGPNVLAAEQDGQVRSELLADNQFVIELRVREDVIEGYDESYSPVLRREPLGEAGTKLGAL